MQNIIFAVYLDIMILKVIDKLFFLFIYTLRKFGVVKHFPYSLELKIYGDTLGNVTCLSITECPDIVKSLTALLCLRR